MRGLVKTALSAALGLGLVAGVVSHASEAEAQKGKKAKAAEQAPAPAPTVKHGRITLSPAGLHWGMSEQDIFRFYDRVIDDDYKPMYQKAQAGPQTERLDAAVANKKAAFRRSKVAFGDLPTGVDSTPLKGEYSYRNGESMLRIRRKGSTRYFFFINGKLWKIYDEIPLGEKRKFQSYQQAVGEFAKRFGVLGRVTEPDYAIGRLFREVDWQDSQSHLRVLDRSGLQVLGLVYEDKDTLSRLASLRTNKVEDPNKLDPEIEALIRPPSQQPGPPDEKKK